MLAEEGEHLAPGIHCLLRSVEWPVPIEDAVASAVVAVELVHLAVLLELGLVLVHLFGARRAVVVAEDADKRAREVLGHVNRRGQGGRTDGSRSIAATAGPDEVVSLAATD